MYKIKEIHGHYEVYDEDDKFYCSADTYEEALHEIKEGINHGS